MTTLDGRVFKYSSIVDVIISLPVRLRLPRGSMNCWHGIQPLFTTDLPLCLALPAHLSRSLALANNSLAMQTRIASYIFSLAYFFQMIPQWLMGPNASHSKSQVICDCNRFAVVLPALQETLIGFLGSQEIKKCIIYVCCILYNNLFTFDKQKVNNDLNITLAVNISSWISLPKLIALLAL